MSEFEQDLASVMGSFIETELDCVYKQDQEIEQLKKKIKQLKEVIDEVKEYVNNPDFIDWHFGVDEGLFRRKELLQILDKVKEVK